MAEKSDILVVEVGGTVGDVESESFLHSISLMKASKSRNCINIHLVLLPYLEHSGELKTKPCQYSVQQLRKTGIQPDIIVGRAKHPLEDSIKDKIAYFSNISPELVFSNYDSTPVYRLPLILSEQNLDDKVIEIMRLEGVPEKKDLLNWESYISRHDSLSLKPKSPVLGFISKYNENYDCYKSVLEAIANASNHQILNVQLR